MVFPLNTATKKPLADELPDKWFSTTYVAEMFDVSVGTVRRWIKDGKLDATLMNGFWKVSKKSLVNLSQAMWGKKFESKEND